MEEEIEQQTEKINYRATFKLILSLMSPHKFKFMLAFSYLVLSTLLNLLNPIIAKFSIDTAIPSKNYLLLLIAITVYFVNSVFFLVFNYLMRMKLVKTGQEIIANLKNRMLRHMLALDLRFYSENP
ncbi:MAG: ABC transporter transmembrane domain-containing protein, partial [Elusimicrobiota bacterium]